MKRTLTALAVIASGLFASAQEDAANCKDHPLFSRMPHTVISECSTNFDLTEIPLGGDKKEEKEGTKTMINYDCTEDESTAPSFYQIVKNYENAIVAKGGKRIYYNSEEGFATLYTKSGNKEIYVVLYDAGGVKRGNYTLNVIEIEGMKQEITAGDMLNALNTEGHIALQINFDTGKSVIRPESQPIVDQIASMLKSNPSLKVSIEGHTDNQGAAAANKTLSESRAKAVVEALAAKGIDRARLSSKGFGQEKPVADNNTESGRAQNRRVEIVKI